MGITHNQSFSVRSTGGGSLSGAETEAGNLELTIDETFSANTVNSVLAIAWTNSVLQSIVLIASQNLTLYANATNEVQRITITGTPTGGTFTITYAGQTTAA